MTQAPLLEYLADLDARYRREDALLAGIEAICAMRRLNRRNTLSARALKGEATKHCNRMRAFRSAADRLA